VPQYILNDNIAIDSPHCAEEQKSINNFNTPSLIDPYIEELFTQNDMFETVLENGLFESLTESSIEPLKSSCDDYDMALNMEMRNLTLEESPVCRLYLEPVDGPNTLEEEFQPGTSQKDNESYPKNLVSQTFDTNSNNPFVGCQTDVDGKSNHYSCSCLLKSNKLLFQLRNTSPKMTLLLILCCPQKKQIFTSIKIYCSRLTSKMDFSA
jgi:hypothetical protein